MRIVLSSIVASVLALATACSQPDERGGAVGSGQPPERFTIAPDDYHVPFAGTAEDGRKFFLSDELFDVHAADDEAAGFVGLFLWHPDGTFAEVRVDRVERAEGVPPGQAMGGGADDLVAKRLSELGNYKLEPIVVEPFTTVVDGVTFGWEVDRYEDGTYFIGIRPGDFIVYYEPWDGLEYDT
ncbi:hypothetical protein [Nocardioides sp. WS12]|uniref:hypothetical protein n=1 Tax=Nocardioides sp. WS12 TaxID=2486272 RepID=UPI0015F81ECD|nr:hypothetical protein [Nocardioides sp. WS12]